MNESLYLHLHRMSVLWEKSVKTLRKRVKGIHVHVLKHRLQASLKESYNLPF